MTAFACDLDIFFSRKLANISTIRLMRWNLALTWNVRTLFLFLLRHGKLLSVVLTLCNSAGTGEANVEGTIRVPAENATTHRWVGMYLTKCSRLPLTGGHLICQIGTHYVIRKLINTGEFIRLPIIFMASDRPASLFRHLSSLEPFVPVTGR